MTSGQWDLDALEALEREAVDVCDVLDIPERVRRPMPQYDPHIYHANHAASVAHHQHYHAHGQQHAIHNSPGTMLISDEDIIDLELEDHIKHCTCTCNHMGYGNYMDYQQTTSCFNGLPDVTEHSNHHHQMGHCEQPTSTINSDPLVTPNPFTTATHSKVLFPSLTDCRRNGSSRANSIRRTQAAMSTAGNAIVVGEFIPCVGGDGSGGGSGTGGGISGFTDEGNLSPTDSSSAVTPTPTNRTGKQQIHVNHRVSVDNRKRWFCLLCSAIIILKVSILFGYFLFFFGRTGRESPEQRMEIIIRLLHETPLIDGHNDLPWNIRRYTNNRLEYLNLSEGLSQTEPWSKSKWSQTDFKRLKEGLVGAQFWSAYVPCEAQGVEAVQIALEQIDLIQRFSVSYAEYTSLVVSAQDILQTHRSGRIGSLIGVEGGHTVSSSLSVLRQMYRLGARYMTLTHRCDKSGRSMDATATTATGVGYAASALHNPPGSNSPADVLSEYGKKIVREMNRLGMMIDLSHSSDETVRAVLNETRAPVIFSHATARSLCNTSQNLDDDVLRAVALNDGIIMISFNAILLACGHPASIQTVIDHLNHVRSVAGIKHIGMGSGFDGFDTTPHGLEDVSKYPHLFAELISDPAWSDEDVRMVAGGNMLRVLREVENTRDNWKLADITPLEAIKPAMPPTSRHKSAHCTPMPS